MLELDELLARPGLAVEERLLVAAKAAIWPADWATLSAVVGRAQERGVPRARIDEVLLQSVLFFGFPRAISAFETVTAAWPRDETVDGGSLPPEQQAHAGRELFAAIYANNTETVLAMLRGFHGELCGFVLEAAYGRILTRPGLPPRTRELLAVGALAVMNQVPQLVAHGRGAIALGASRLEVQEAVLTATRDESRARELLRRLRAPND